MRNNNGMEQLNERRKMNRRDWILVAIVLAAAVLLAAFFRFSGRSTGNAIRIRVNGEEIGRYALNKNRTIKVENHYGKNVIVIQDGEAYMEEADCPDHYCIQQGRIHRANETIVCLPHKLVVEVVTGEGASGGQTPASDSSHDVDVIAQ